MQNLGLWGDVSHLLQNSVLVVKSYNMWVSGGVACIYICLCMCMCMCIM